MINEIACMNYQNYCDEFKKSSERKISALEGNGAQTVRLSLPLQTDIIVP